MNTFEILADSGHDLPKTVAAELGIVTVPLMVTYDENTVFPDGAMDDHEFYEGIRAGKMPKTAAVNPAQWAEKMRPALEQGKDVLVLTVSSGLSTTYQSAVIAAEELGEHGRYLLPLLFQGHLAALCCSGTKPYSPYRAKPQLQPH